ncbi:MAG: hypothetical protein R3Y61_06055 [Rikenellaceae bacterium]
MKKVTGFAMNFVPLFLIAFFFCKINPLESYVWYDGMWDGLCFIPNLVFSLFDDGRLIKAVDYTSGYGIWWWICTIIAVLHVIQTCSTILFPAKDKK